MGKQNRNFRVVPKVKSIMSPDLKPGASPINPRNCHVFIEVEIGPINENGGDIFSFEVVTPSALAGMEHRWGRGLLIVNEFSWMIVDSALERLCSYCTGSSWDEISAKLNKEMYWEFENYQESSSNS